MADRNKLAKQREQSKFAMNQAGKHMLDVTGKQLKVGQTVDIPMNGMFRGYVVQAVESVIAMPGRPPQPPHVMVELHIPRVVQDPMGNVPLIYIVAEPPEVEEKPGEPTAEKPAEGLIKLA